MQLTKYWTQYIYIFFSCSMQFRVLKFKCAKIHALLKFKTLEKRHFIRINPYVI